MTTNVINKGWFNPISLSVLLILVIVSAVLYVSKIINIPIFILLLLLSGLVTSAIRIADQWERAVVLRMGKYNGLKGPGPFMIIPVIDSVSTYIDQRVRVSAFKAEQTLTKDTQSYIGPSGTWKKLHWKYRSTKKRSNISHRLV